MQTKNDCMKPPRVSLKWRFLIALTNWHFAKQLAGLSLDGYLADVGWTRSAREKKIVGADGRPLPWATYSFIEFIKARLGADWTVFEYGAGASTLFYASRVARVIAVEHDADFAKSLRLELPENVELMERELGAGYIQAVDNLLVAPALVSVDGRDRVACVGAAEACLAPAGVIVLDDAERAEYDPAWEVLRTKGYKRLDFWGFAPGQTTRKCTSVFYRGNNVLGL
jgi:hypothetical protein